jgi:hypothetical protein
VIVTLKNKYCLSCYVNEEIFNLFLRLAAMHGGRSVFLRKLIYDSLKKVPDIEGLEMCSSERRTSKVIVYLKPQEFKMLQIKAMKRCMAYSQWIVSLIRVNLGSGVQYNSLELKEIHALTNQLARIGSNLNQMTRCLHEARLRNISLDLDLEVLERLSLELKKVMNFIHLSFSKNLASWKEE